MIPEILFFAIMLAMFVLAAMWWRLPIGISLIIASLAGTLVSGEGIPIRHLVEGTFAYLDPIFAKCD